MTTEPDSGIWIRREGALVPVDDDGVVSALVVVVVVFLYTGLPLPAERGAEINRRLPRRKGNKRKACFAPFVDSLFVVFEWPPGLAGCFAKYVVLSTS